jgi:hypothetical protein
MKTLPLKEFKPTILFLVKFIGIYIVANLLYGVYVTAYSPGPDPITSLASRQTAVALGICGWHSSTEDNETKPTTLLIHEDHDHFRSVPFCIWPNRKIVMDICVGRYNHYSLNESCAHCTAVLGYVISSGSGLLCTQIPFYGRVICYRICAVDRLGEKVF